MRGNALNPFGEQIAGRRTAEVAQTENADHPLALVYHRQSAHLSCATAEDVLKMIKDKNVDVAFRRAHPPVGEAADPPGGDIRRHLWAHAGSGVFDNTVLLRKTVR
jgi:hypothetical protein